MCISISPFRRMFHYSTALRKVLWGISPITGRKFLINSLVSFSLLQQTLSKRATVHELPMRLHIDVRETPKWNVFLEALVVMQGIACRTPLRTMEYLSECESPSIAPRRNTSWLFKSLLRFLSMLYIFDYIPRFHTRDIHLAFIQIESNCL